MGFFENLFKRNEPTVNKPIEQAQKPSTERVSGYYFSTLGKIQSAISEHNFKNAARFVRENLPQIEGLVKETSKEFGSFDIGSIPALEQGGTALALVGDVEGLSEMKRIVNSIPELKPWAEEVEQHFKELQLFPMVLKAIAENPGCQQTEVKNIVKEKDGHRIANILFYLEKAGQIDRVKLGKTNTLFIAGSVDVPKPLPKRRVESHRRERNRPKFREIDISSLDYVPLPRSPLAWEEKGDKEKRISTDSQEQFEVREADWKISSVEKLSVAERPDPAFRQLHPTNSGMLIIDDLGKAEGFGQIEGSALRYDRTGALVAKKPLLHSVYRIGVHPCGRGLIVMSKDCVVHAYDENLNMFLETSLVDSPEIQAIRKRFEISDDQLKNHIRCVALSQDAKRYLITVVDEAWCLEVNGQGLWGTKLPFKEGWTRVSTPSTKFCTSAEVDKAIALMNLSLPITPDGLKQRYRELAKKWHPDVNPDNFQAEERMKALNSAIEVLTGIDVNNIPQYTGATFMREFSRTEIKSKGFNVTLTMGMQVDEKFASDWIYAAGFAASSDKVYLCGYSGRVVLVDENGNGKRVYDIGSVPRRIVDTGEFLYLLTDTRLYVLHDDALHALIDTFDGGDFIVAQTGFGLLENKRLRWFGKDGKNMGSVVSKEPIRRVYTTEAGLVIETRQRRAVVKGAPKWWE